HGRPHVAEANKSECLAQGVLQTAQAHDAPIRNESPSDGRLILWRSPPWGTGTVDFRPAVRHDSDAVTVIQSERRTRITECVVSGWLAPRSALHIPGRVAEIRNPLAGRWYAGYEVGGLHPIRRAHSPCAQVPAMQIQTLRLASYCIRLQPIRVNRSAPCSHLVPLRPPS